MVRLVIEFDHEVDDPRLKTLAAELEKRGIEYEWVQYRETGTAIEVSDEYASSVIEAAEEAGLCPARVYVPDDVKRYAAERLAMIERMTDEIRAELSAVDEALRELYERLPAAVYEEVAAKLREMQERMKKLADAIENNAEEIREYLAR